MTPDRRTPSTDLPPPSGPQPLASSSTDRSADGDVARSNELTAVVRAEIQSNPDRRITFARYMELALYEPRLGYYRQAADRPTDAGDFLTAPETHAIFGWTVARRIEAMWAGLSRPWPFDLIEYGAGSGTLALSILESSPNRLADLYERFEKAGLAGRLATSSSYEDARGTASNGSVPVTGVILANEFLDAIPIHRFVVRGGKLLELYVAWKDGFVEVPGEPSTPALAERLTEDGLDVNQLAEGQIGEISLGLGEWLRGVAARLARGYVVVIDYGHHAADLYGPRRLAGTLLGYRGHRVVENPFDAPGQVDLTAHVDFTALEKLAAANGFRTVLSTTQSEFLVATGLEEELRALQASPDLTLADYARARSGIVRMLDPRHMGRFRVLILERG
jgi:SAM-dependent MidA family methyltransferase